MIYMLDTNTASYIITGRSLAARGRYLGLRSGKVTVSAITEAELWYGVQRHRVGTQRTNTLRLFLDQLSVASWGRPEAAAYGAFRARQEAMGMGLAPLDTMIAAHAIVTGATLVTHDAAFRHAIGLPGLEDWATDV